MRGLTNTHSISLGLFLAVVFNVLFAFAPTMVGNADLQPASAASAHSRLLVAACTLFFFGTGVGAAIAETSLIMLVGNRFKDNAGKVMASISTACGIGCMIGPLIGGVLYDLAPADAPGTAFRLPFFTMATFLALLSWPLRFTIDHDHLGLRNRSDNGSANEPAPTADAKHPHHYARLRTPSVSLGLVAILLSGAVVGSLDPTLSYRMQAPPFWFSDGELAATFTLSSIVYALLSVPVGALCDLQPTNSVRLKGITAVGFAALGLTFFLLAPFGGLDSSVSLSGAFNTPELAVFAMAIKGVGSALSTSAVYLDLGLGIGEHEEALQSTMSSLWNAAYALGWSLGPLVGGALYSFVDRNELCLSGASGAAKTCLNATAPRSTAALSGGRRCSCEWAPRNGFDGLASLLSIACVLYTALVFGAASRNTRDFAPPASPPEATADADGSAAGATESTTVDVVVSGGQSLLDKPPPAGSSGTEKTCVTIGAVAAIVTWAVLVILAVQPRSSAAMHAHCAAMTTFETHLPDGPSRGLSYCIDEFVRSRRAVPGENEYLNTIDGAKDVYSLTASLGCTIQPVNASVEWQATIRPGPWPAAGWWGFDYPRQLPGQNGNYTAVLNRAVWMLPPGYQSAPAEARLVFVHGCDITCSALGPYYLGFVALLANWTRLPVLAVDFASEPITPWPNNIRNVLYFIHFALGTGPGGPGRADSIFVLGDSEGTLVTTQTMMTLFDDTLRREAGYGLVLSQPETWLAGVILSSPALDVSCDTESFSRNCFNFTGDPNAVPPTAHTGTGDPDTGDCTWAPTLAEQGALFKKWCRWSYLPYFFGMEGIASANTMDEADAFWTAHSDFYNLPNVNPLRAGPPELQNLPPFLLLAGTRDMYYTDSSSLGTLMCEHGVDVQVYNAVGAYHDFIEYSLGCGGGYPMAEAVHAYERIVAFIGEKRHVR